MKKLTLYKKKSEYSQFISGVGLHRFSWSHNTLYLYIYMLQKVITISKKTDTGILRRHLMVLNDLQESGMKAKVTLQRNRHLKE